MVVGVKPEKIVVHRMSAPLNFGKLEKKYCDKPSTSCYSEYYIFILKIFVENIVRNPSLQSSLNETLPVVFVLT